MPSKSKAQERLMRAVAHGWQKPGGGGPSRAVAEEFVAADAGKQKKAEGGEIKSRFQILREEGRHFIAHNGKAEFKIAKSGLPPQRVAKFRTMCKGGEVKLADGGEVPNLTGDPETDARIAKADLGPAPREPGNVPASMLTGDPDTDARISAGLAAQGHTAPAADTVPNMAKDALRALPLAGVHSPIGAVLDKATGGRYAEVAPQYAGLFQDANATPEERAAALQGMGIGMAAPIAYHGSPHVFDKFSMDKIGTGEGAQAYGHGLYFTSEPKVAELYRDRLTPEAEVKFKGEYAPSTLDMVVARIQSGADPASAITEARQYAIQNMKVAKAEGRAEGLAYWRDATKALYEPDVTPENFTVGRAPSAFYQVDIPDNLLRPDVPLKEHPPEVQEALKKVPATEVQIGGTPVYAYETSYDPVMRHLAYELKSGSVAKTREWLTQQAGARGPIGEEARATLAKLEDLVSKGQLTDAASPWKPEDTGAFVRNRMEQIYGPKKAAEMLREAGIPGHVYTGDSSGVENYVVYDDSKIKPLGRFPSLAEFQKTQEQPVYHVTPRFNLDAIRKEGLRPDAPKLSTDGPHGETRAVFLGDETARDTYRSLYGDDAAVLRAKRGAIPGLEPDLHSEGEAWMARKAIPPEALEIQMPDGTWAPLAKPQKKARGGEIKGTGMNLKNVKLVRETPEAWHADDGRGEFKIAKAGLSNEMRSRIAQHFAEGGEALPVEDVPIPTPAADAVLAGGTPEEIAATIPEQPPAPAASAPGAYDFTSWAGRNLEPGAPSPGFWEGLQGFAGRNLPPEQQAAALESIRARGAPPADPNPALNFPLDTGHTPGGVVPGVAGTVPTTTSEINAASASGALAAPGPVGGGVPGVQGEITSAYRKAAAAEQAKADVAKKQAAETVAVQQQSIAAREKLSADWQKTWGNWQQRGDEMRQAILDQKIDPNHYWEQKGTGGKISAAIGLILGGMGSGLTRTPNAALEVIRESINRDLDAQKAELGKKATLLGLHMQQGQALQSAYQLARADMLDVAAAKIQMVGTKYAGDQAQAVAQGATAALQREAALTRQSVAAQGLDMALKAWQLRMIPYQMQFMQEALRQQGAGAGNGYVPSAANPPMLTEPSIGGIAKAREQQNQLRVELPGLGAGRWTFAKTPEAAKASADTLGTLDNLTLQVRKLATTAGSHNVAMHVPGTAAKATYESLASSLTTELNKLQGLNRLNENEYKEFGNMIPTKKEWLTSSGQAKVQSLLNLIQAKKLEEYTQHLGLDPRLFAPKSFTPGT